MAKRHRKIKRENAESPSSACLVICDDVLVSQGKNKHILQGVIGTIVVRGVPALIGGYVAYIQLTNVYPNQEIKLCLRDEDENAIFESEAKSPPRNVDPLAVETLILPIPFFPITSAGRYTFRAEHDGVPFAVCPITVVDQAPKEAS